MVNVTLIGVILWLPKCLHWPFCPGLFIAILGFLAAIVTFLEKPPRVIKALCIVLFFSMMCGEIWMISKDRDVHDKEEQDDRDLAQQQFAATNLLALQGMKANDHLADIERKIDAAKGNSQLIQSLEAQAKSARAQVDEISKQLLIAATPKGKSGPTNLLSSPPSQYSGLRDDELITAAKNVVGEIQDKMGAWKFRTREVNESNWNQFELKTNPSDEERQELEHQRVQTLKSVDDKFSNDIKELFSRADDIRRSLVTHLQHNGVQPPVEDSFADLIANGADGYSDQRVTEACSHLLILSKQLVRP